MDRSSRSSCTPSGTLSGVLTVDGAETAVTGVGYHDHNWGTAPLRKLVDYWYWGRARIGDYTVVTLNFISHPDYGHNCHPAFMVASGGEMLASGERDIEFSATDIRPNETTGAQVANCLRYTYRGGDESYAVCFERNKDVFTLDFGGEWRRRSDPACGERRPLSLVRLAGVALGCVSFASGLFAGDALALVLLVFAAACFECLGEKLCSRGLGRLVG